MAEPTRPALHHLALTVTDLDASIAWYQQAFGIKQQMEEEHKGGVGKLLADETFQFVIVLHRHDANDGQSFAETRTGMDHVGLAVPTRADLGNSGTGTMRRFWL